LRPSHDAVIIVLGEIICVFNNAPFFPITLLYSLSNFRKALLKLHFIQKTNFCFIISLAAFALEPNYDVRIDLSIGVLKAVEVSFALNNIDAARGLWIFKPVLPAEPLLA
jgi:hypothetical protein